VRLARAAETCADTGASPERSSACSRTRTRNVSSDEWYLEFLSDEYRGMEPGHAWGGWCFRSEDVRSYPGYELRAVRVDAG
jgi:hypothetical protein